MTLYHGTTRENAKLLLKNGFIPNQVGRGSNQGQSQFLYLTTDEENALWFSEQSGSNIVLEISNINESWLIVDPEDGVGESVEDELKISMRTKTPANFALKFPIGPEHFKLISGTI